MRYLNLSKINVPVYTVVCHALYRMRAHRFAISALQALFYLRMGAALAVVVMCMCLESVCLVKFLAAKHV